MKKTILLLIVLMFCLSSCETLDRWFFDAGDYHLRDQKLPSDSTDREDYFWNEPDYYDLWIEDQEYD